MRKVGDTVWIARKGVAVKGEITSICHGVHVEVKLAIPEPGADYVSIYLDKCYDTQKEVQI